MSSFVSQSVQREPIEWRERAYETVDRDNHMVDTAIALFAGLGVASFASPIAGLAVGVLMVKRIFDKETQKQKAKDLIIQKGLAAPFLSGHDFTDFLHQAGEEAVYRELEFAGDRDVDLSDPAWEFLETYKLQNALPQGVPMPIAPDEALRIDAPDSTTPTQKKQALSALLASPYVSRAIFGAQRTGKSYLAAVASFELAKQGTKIYHLNLASYGDEDQRYWSHTTQSIRGDLASIDSESASRVIQSAIALVQEFFSQNNAVLIVDEIVYIGSKSGAHAALLDPLMRVIADKITALESTGIKRQKAIWTVAPSFVAGSLSDQCKVVKKLQLCYISIAPGRSIEWDGNRIGFNAELFEQIKNNFPISMPVVGTMPNCDRLCFINGQWMAVGALPSLPKLPTPASASVVDARTHLEASLTASVEGRQEALELIQAISNLTKREALMIAYQWAQTRLKDRKEVDRAAFLERARKERKSEYLRDHRDEIWNELQGLLDEP